MSRSDSEATSCGESSLGGITIPFSTTSTSSFLGLLCSDTKFSLLSELLKSSPLLQSLSTCKVDNDGFLTRGLLGVSTLSTDLQLGSSIQLVTEFFLSGGSTTFMADKGGAGGFLLVLLSLSLEGRESDEEAGGEGTSALLSTEGLAGSESS